ncbi:septum formation initiator family protein [Corynebacterium sp. MC-21]|uniref:FtsB family cell division protein n=1 Tax=Corynebacterium parakroppenstedtii TaxID=2828363 RepID=UPI001EF0B88E|nr:septum formation initiator family protein [Corynebacterium parakroppenstedtii]MCF6779093.1 septum formation initiator family protein [Corynebacterium parakroppenstedtii]MCF6789253.1 septum formation initiator family protein [Corynebacterium parakroppenstedtii]MDU3198136.1 septum formation initiator family protein [Corynebacterium kroppenstedtii]
MARSPESGSPAGSDSLAAGGERDHVDSATAASTAADHRMNSQQAGKPDEGVTVSDSDAGVESDTASERKGTLPKPMRQSRRRRAQRRLREFRFGGSRKQWVLTVPSQQSAVRLIILACLVVAMTMTIAPPLKSYFQQRSELQQLHIDIAHQEEEKAELQKQLDLYNDDDFVKEQARLRLGMVERGETSWRIIDPSITTGTPEESDSKKDEQQDPWYTQLWSSVREKPSDKEQHEDEAPSLGVPTVNDPDPNRQAPAPANGNQFQPGN